MSASRFWEENGVLLGLVALTVIAIVAAVAHSNWRESKAIADGPGEIVSAALVDDAQRGGVLVLAEAIALHDGDEDWKAWRTSALGISDGRLLGRRLRGRAAPTCESAGPGRVWCTTSDGGLELLDTTLAVVADRERLLATSGALAQGVARGELVGVVRGTHELELVGMQGDRVRIHPRTLVARLVGAEEPRAPALGAMQGTGTAGSVQLGGRELLLEGHPLARLATGASNPRTIVSDATFLRGRFLSDPFTAPSRGVTSDGMALLAYDASLATDALVRYCAVRADGTKAWEVADAHGAVVAAHVEGGVVSVVVHHERGYVLGVDARAGTTRYRYDGAR